MQLCDASSSKCQMPIVPVWSVCLIESAQVRAFPCNISFFLCRSVLKTLDLSEENVPDSIQTSLNSAKMNPVMYRFVISVDVLSLYLHTYMGFLVWSYADDHENIKTSLWLHFFPSVQQGWPFLHYHKSLVVTPQTEATGKHMQRDLRTQRCRNHRRVKEHETTLV